MRLKQVLTNLISNAIKFSDKGDIIIRVEPAIKDKASVTLKFSVADTGIGLSDEQKKKLFNPFVQADTSNSREHSGTGLGLAISKGIVDKMGGEIGVNSTPNQGSTFWFTAHLGVAHQQSLSIQDISSFNILLYSLNNHAKEYLFGCLAGIKANFTSTNTLQDILPLIKDHHQSGNPFDLLIFDTSFNEKGNSDNIINNLVKQAYDHFKCKTIIITTPNNLYLDREIVENSTGSIISKPLTYAKLINQLYITLGISTTHEPDSIAYSDPSNLKAQYQHLSILVVDDNPANLQLAGELLLDIGVNVELAASGPQAIELFEEQPFDLVFMDIQMPEMDGLETSRRLRHMESTNQHTPIVALTAHAAIEQKSQLLLAGMDDFLSKPVSEQQLVDVLQRLVLESNAVPTNEAPEKLDKQTIANQQKAHLPKPVDISLSLKRANGKHSLAKDMLTMLVKTLEKDHHAIQLAFKGKDYDLLQELIHKLHGGCSYCGVPDLKDTSLALDDALQKGEFDKIPDLMPILSNRVSELIQWQLDHDLDEIFTPT